MDGWRARVYRVEKKITGLEHYEWRQIRDQIIERDKYTCLRCDVKFRYKKYLTVHHLIPRAEGGATDPGNLVTLCSPCHDFVEINQLRTRADIIGSYEQEPIEIINPTKDDSYDDHDPYNRPEWHKYVYGGMKRKTALS